MPKLTRADTWWCWTLHEGKRYLTFSIARGRATWYGRAWWFIRLYLFGWVFMWDEHGPTLSRAGRGVIRETLDP